jgi:glycosyltransferase involved in cell wall biosynthesis
LRIGIDAACWSNKRGYGRFTRELLNAILDLDHDNEYVLFVDPETNTMANFPNGVTRIVLDVTETPSNAASASGNRSLKNMWKTSRTVSREDLDIFFYPSVYTYFPIFSKAKKIVAIHDVIAEQYPQLVFTNKKHRFFWNLKVWVATKQADLILTVSEFSKKGITEEFKIPENHIRVVTEAADHIFCPVHKTGSFYETLSRFGLDTPAKFILYVGGIAPHKNLSVLINAYSKLINRPNYTDIRLVLVGDYDKDVFLIDYKLKEQIKQLCLVDKVIFTGFIEDYELVYLYNASYVFVLPSFCEGFGLPAVEAMACGTPVIGSKTTSLPEVVGNAGLFFDPNSADELLEKLIYVLDNNKFRDELSQRSLQRAVTFSWQKSAVQALNIFKELGENGHIS